MNVPDYTMISEVIRTGRTGTIDALAAEMLAEVVRGVLETGGKGSLTLKFSVSKNGDNQIMIDVKPTKNVPLADLGSIMMFADSEGRLTRNDTRQEELFSGPRGIVEPRRMIRDEEAANNA